MGFLGRLYPPPVGTPRKAAPKSANAPPRLGVLVTPFVVFGFAAVVAALHRLLGEPLGPTAATKLAELWQTMAMMLVVYTPALGRHQRALRVAARYEALAAPPAPRPTTRPTLALRKEPADDNPDHGPRRRTGPR